MSDSDSPSGAEGQQRGKKRVTREEFNALADETHDMFNMVADMQQSLQELLERGEAQPGEDGEVAAVGHQGESKEAKAAYKDRVAVWKNTMARKGWMLIGGKTVMMGCKQAELQAVLARKTQVTQAVTSQLTSLAGFRVEDYLPAGPGIKAADLALSDQMDIMVDAITTVLGKGVSGDACRDRLDTLKRGLEEGAGTLREHARENFLAIRVPQNKARLVKMVNGDMDEWSSRLVDIAATAAVEWMVPPEFDSLPAVPVPKWSKLNAYMAAGGLINAEEHAHQAPVAKRARTKGPARAEASDMPCFGWALPRGCRFGQECIYTHDPAKAWQGGGTKGSGKPRKVKREEKHKGGSRAKKQDGQNANSGDAKNPDGGEGGGVMKQEDE